MSLAARSTADERMDTDCVDFDDYRRCLRDLSRVNTVTLTHRPMLAWLARETAGLRVVLAARCRLRSRRRAAPHPPLGHATRYRGAASRCGPQSVGDAGGA